MTIVSTYLRGIASLAFLIQIIFTFLLFAVEEDYAVNADVRFLKVRIAYSQPR